MKICLDLSLNSFLKAFQLNVFDYGLPEFCHSDLGSQLVAGSNLVSEFLNNETSLQYLKEKGVNPLSFKQFPKGRKELGGIVESSVKQVKKLLFGSYGKNVLLIRDQSHLKRC